MTPALVDGDHLLISRFACRLGAPAHGDIVLLRDPSRPGSECIKRILALPDETVRLDGLVASIQEPAEVGASANGSLCVLGSDQYFVAGDNAAHSTDSRSFGPVSRSAILGRAWYRYKSRDGRTGLLR